MTNATNGEQARAWVEVDLAAVRENYRTMQRHAGTALIPMVKADAYGLGALRVVRTLEPEAPLAFGVATVAEGVALRDAGIGRPILVAAPVPPETLEAAAQARLTVSISDTDALERWAAAADRHGPLDFHVEIDTGIGRAGFDWRETAQWSEAVRARLSPALQWRGVFTHFHSADAPDAALAGTQWQRFHDALAQLPVSREDLLVHACNSAAGLRWPHMAADAVRPGIFLYGGHPARDVAGVPAPRPVASVRARITLVRSVPPGSTLGYGATHVARGWERWGTVALGYGDGLRRSLGGQARMLVHGESVPMVGRTSMDMTVVDVSAIPAARAGDVVTFIGRDGAAEILLDDVAQLANTIGYEILTGLTPRLPRLER